MPIDFKKALNEEQYRIVTEGDGACLVLAGAGSGKTRTLVYRVAWLLEQGVRPQDIMLVTFTNKAAKEMLGRVDALTDGKSTGLFGGTFHSLGNRLLHQYADRLGYVHHFTILDADDSKTLMRSIYRDQRIEKQTTFPKPDLLCALWSFTRNQQGVVDDLFDDRLAHLHPQERERVHGLLQRYEDQKRAAQAMDFDDLLVQWLALLTEHADIRARLSKRFRYILVDEYQDTNVLQGAIVRALAEQHGNILVVGDDAQSIYSFRAATIRNILDFPKQYPNARVFRLEQNYRSTKNILDLANASITKNQEQHKKQLQSVKGAGVKPECYGAADGRAQARWILETARRRMDEGVPLRSFAVLFRAAYHALDVELALAEAGIPYVMRGGIRFFEQAHVKDVLSYLRVFVNLNDAIAWRRILLMEEGIGPVKVEQMWQKISRIENPQRNPTSHQGLRGEQELGIKNETLSQLSFLPSNAFNILKKFVSLEENILKDGIDTILRLGYRARLQSMYENADERLEDLVELTRFTSRYDTLEAFLNDAALSEGFRGERTENEDVSDALVLSTIHQAKGLEWDTVFLIGLSDGQFPHHKVNDHPHELEEERRLFYVAATRAKERLYLTYPMLQHGTQWSRPSRFLEELPPHVLKKQSEPGDDFLQDESEQTIHLDEHGERAGILDTILKTRKRKRYNV